MICVFVLTFSSSVSALQQSTTQSGDVAGVVVDQNGAPVEGAEVTMLAGAATARTKTDITGQFHFTSVPLAAITLNIAASGFAPVRTKIEPATQDTTQLRIVLLPAAISEQVTVAATRTETRIGETAASVVVLGSQDLKSTAAITIDDALRQVPGFSLFRRAGSRTANPTTQGVSLRGLGASGASRALVLVDGVPLNDPFGGWVYWDRVPRESVDEVEVLRGASSHLYGSSALGGVVSISTRTAATNALDFAVSYGNEQTPDGSLFLSGRKHDWAASLAAESFSTRSYVLVAPDERGPVDTRAGSRHAVMNLKVERWFGKNQHIFGSSSFFGESRKNGTPLQINRTHIRQFSFGGELTSDKTSNFSARVYGGTQVYDQTFGHQRGSPQRNTHSTSARACSVCRLLQSVVPRDRETDTGCWFRVAAGARRQ